VHILLKIVGYGLVLFSVCFLVVFTAMLFDPDEAKQLGVIVGFLAMLAGLLGGGVYLIRAGSRRSAEKTERRLLKIAAAKGGALSAEEAAIAIQLDVGECQKRLERLCEQGVCQLLVTDLGGMRYVFPSLLSEKNKQAGLHPLGPEAETP
jgi:hypothetical protein